MQGNAPDEEYEDPHGECRHEIDGLRLRNSALTDALRKVAIVHRYRPAEGGDMVFLGAGCEICEADCGPEQQIVHVGDCPLTVLNPQQ